MKHLNRYLFTVFLALACSCFGANISEYSVKAGYLAQFAQSVKWPKTAFSDDHTPIVVGILGDDPFGKILDDEVQDKTVEGRSLIVKRFGFYEKAKLGGLRNCQILFIASSEQDNIREILSGLKDSPLLTVSEVDQFPMMGGILQFNQEGDSIGLILNPKTAKRSGLKLSSELIKLSKISMEVNSSIAKNFYYEGVQLYIKGEIRAAIQKWKNCLEEDPDYEAAAGNITRAREKLKAIESIPK